MSTPEPSTRATRYEVSCLPLNHPERQNFTVTVELDPSERWSVLLHERYPDGKVIAQRYGSDLSESRALEIARKIASTMNFLGHSVEDILAMSWLVDGG